MVGEEVCGGVRVWWVKGRGEGGVGVRGVEERVGGKGKGREGGRVEGEGEERMLWRVGLFERRYMGNGRED